MLCSKNTDFLCNNALYHFLLSPLEILSRLDVFEGFLDRILDREFLLVC